MMHTSLNGSAGHDIYAPCSLADLDAHGYDYWALGHIHRRMEHRGRATVVMPGVPQGRDIGESGPASVTLGVVDGTGLRLEQRSVASLRFDRLAVDLAGAADWGDALAALDQALRDAATLPRSEEHLVLRPRLMGNTPLAWRIARDLDRLTDEARASASGMTGLWIDRLENATAQPSGADADGTGNVPDELLRILHEDLADDPALSNVITDMARDLLRDLPPELRDLLGDNDTEFATACADLLRQGSDTTLAAQPDLPEQSDHDELLAQEAALQGRVDLLRAETQERFAALAEARRRVNAVGGDDAVARIESERVNLLNDLREAARNHLAGRFGLAALETGLRRYRDNHRSAMLTRASDAFCQLSRGAYSALSAQPEGTQEVLVAQSHGGGAKLAADLSKGTRFQLYLALRIAGYHELAKSRTTVPLIADDIMETFDDDRAAEAFALLGDMSRSGQVIYLTHHRHLCDIARTTCPAARVIDL